MLSIPIGLDAVGEEDGVCVALHEVLRLEERDKEGDELEAATARL